MTSPIDAVGPTATLPVGYDPTRADVNATDSGSASGSALKLDPNMFLQLLVAQLKYQDPTNPVDTSKFMQQTAALTQVQSMNAMTSSISELLTAQQTQTATDMVGKAIAFVDPAGETASGIVDSMFFDHGRPMLQVGDYAVSLGGILQVTNPVEVPGDSSGIPSHDDVPGDSTVPDVSGPGETDADGTVPDAGSPDTGSSDNTVPDVSGPAAGGDPGSSPPVDPDPDPAQPTNPAQPTDPAQPTGAGPSTDPETTPNPNPDFDGSAPVAV